MAPDPLSPGWHLLGSYPDPQDDGVGSWLLHHGGEAALLELPPGLTVRAVREGLGALNCSLKYVLASHHHEDHLDRGVLYRVRAAFPGAKWWHPGDVKGDLSLDLGGEILWVCSAPKHSLTDCVVVFRGVAMTGDVELGTLDSVNEEVDPRTKAASLRVLAAFEARTGHKVHTTVSAHLNDHRTMISHWPSLFTVSEGQ